jgi:ABC-type dipeptide/oligopeptide/nickel transport system permease component
LDTRDLIGDLTDVATQALRRLAAHALLALVVAGALFLAATTNYTPSAGRGGTSASAVGEWALREPGDPGRFDPSNARSVAEQARQPAVSIVLSATLNSSVIVVLATSIATTLGVASGLWLAIQRRNPIAVVVRSLGNVLVALPAFYVAFLAQIAAVELGSAAGRTLIPVFGFGYDSHLLVPVASLSLGASAYVTQLVATRAETTAAFDYVRTARAKGLRERAIAVHHIMPNLWPTIAEGALSAVRIVLSGLVIVEYLSAWPGLGILLLRAINVQDAQVLLMSTAVLATLFAGLQRLSDHVAALSQPARST